MIPFIGQILQFAGNFAPRGYAVCAGQLLPIAQYDALYALLGTTYGGDGVNTFGLPSLAGRVPVHQGTLAGGSTYVLGMQAGQTNVTVSTAQLPSHSHGVNVVSTGSVGDSSPGSAEYLADEFPSGSKPSAYLSAAPNVAIAPGSIGPTGSNVPHANLQPVLAITVCIALEGRFPSRN